MRAADLSGGEMEGREIFTQGAAEGRKEGQDDWKRAGGAGGAAERQEGHEEHRKRGSE